MQKIVAGSMAVLLAAGGTITPVSAHAQSGGSTATPIKHLVVIFQENVSFDHYFGTYPNATNPQGEPRFTAAPGTPSVNGYTDGLLKNNPNALNTTLNGAGAANPFRLDRSQAATADQDHDYTPEQEAFDHGLMDGFPKFTGTPGPPPAGLATPAGLVMGYFDGNTVTAIWNYAQHYALDDNSYGTNFGPSTDGAINLISGQTNNVTDEVSATGSVIGDGNGGLTLISDADPVGDVCSTTTGAQVGFTGTNVGDLLNAQGISWGFFQGGFDLTVKNANGTTGCARTTTSSVTGVTENDYIQHHQPFQYYSTTQNLQHTRPSSPKTVGMAGDPGNHQYDIHDFFDAINDGNFPTVSFLKAPGFEDGHAGYSDPLDEQNFIVTVINFLQQQRDWDQTAVVIAYDDSDGWYDHQIGPIVNQSATTADELTGPGACGTGANALPGVTAAHAQGRCGYGPRLPLLVISPFAKQNFVDHTVTDQSSILRFIEDNWLDGQRITGSFDALAGTLNNMFDFNAGPSRNTLLLNPSTGEPVPSFPLPPFSPFPPFERWF
jgi:phospholipase C